jgi:hypothetical protein
MGQRFRPTELEPSMAEAETSTKIRGGPVRKLSLFGPPPLVAGEDSAGYDQLLERVAGAVKPGDIFEEIWVRDFVDNTWEILRLRRAKKAVIANGVADALESALLPVFGPQDKPWYPEGLSELVKKWAAGDAAAVSKVEELMASAKLTMDMIIDRAFVNAIETIERIEHLITIAEHRRNANLREIERHRASFAEVLRKGIPDVEDVEFQPVEPKAISSNDRARKNVA